MEAGGGSGDWWNRVVFNPWERTDREMVAGLYEGLD